jgi:hypothetical protein
VLRPALSRCFLHLRVFHFLFLKFLCWALVLYSTLELLYAYASQHVRVHADERVQHAHCHLAFKSQSAEEAVVEATAALAAELLGDDVHQLAEFDEDDMARVLGVRML